MPHLERREKGMDGYPQEFRRVYLDNNATTQLRPEVVEAMLPYLREHYGNPSSGHWFGRSVRTRIEEAREKAAALIGAKPEEVYFCGGGSESDNTALKGAAFAKPRGASWRVVTSDIEHPAVLSTAGYLAQNGYCQTVVGVDRYGVVDSAEMAAALDSTTAVVSVMHANNETGSIQPVRRIADAVRARGALMHCDAAQSAGKIPIDVNELGVDMLSMSAHKLYAPKGMGLLYIRKGVKIHPLITGGHHERGMRAGTENVAGIVGLGTACELARKGLAEDAKKITALRNRLQKGIMEKISSVRLNGHPEQRLPGTLNISIEGAEGETLLIQCDTQGIALSTGSACASGSAEPSHVLVAMGIPRNVIQGSLRISIGIFNTGQDVDYLLERLPKIADAARAS